MKKMPTRRCAVIGTVLAILLLAAGAQAQNLFITDWTGNDDEGLVAEIMTNGVGSTYSIFNASFPAGVAFDASGRLFVANDPDSDGAGNDDIVVISNKVQKVFSSSVNRPYGLAFDKAGDLFEADYGSSNICEFVSNNGILTTNVNVFASGLNGPVGLAFDNAGNLFEADSGSSNIYEFAPNGTPTLFASGVSDPTWLAFNSAGNLLVVGGSSNIYEFTTNGVESLFATNVPEADGLAFNNAGILFVLGFQSDLFEILPNNMRITLAPASYGEGLAFQGVTLPVSTPSVPPVTSQNLFVATLNSGILEYTPGGTQSTFASKINTGSGATTIPYQMTFDSSGNLFGTSQNQWVFGFPAGGIPGTFAPFNSFPDTTGLALSSNGVLYVANSSGNNILEIMPGGSTNIFTSGLDGPQGLAFDSAGDLFEADTSSGRIYEFTNNAGTLSSNLTVFATGFSRPIGLAFDGSGDLFAADWGSGKVYEFANDDGTLSSNQTIFASSLSEPWSLAFNNTGNLFVADRGTGIIYQYTPGGTQSIFATGLSLVVGLAFEPVPVLAATSINGTAQVTVTMPSPYYSTILQSSPDLVNWTPICTNTPPFTFTNSSPASSSFYRAVLNTSLY